MASATAASAGGPSRPLVLPGYSGPLKYANAQDVPSYPSPGLKPGGAAASAAAALGWTTTAVSSGSPREHQPGAPRSPDALLAAGWAQRQPQKSPPPPASPPSPWVSTAASLAFRSTKTPPPVSERPELSRQNSMQAAKGAMSARPRSRSSPQTTVEKTASGHSDTEGYALSAATIAHRPSIRASTVSTGEAGAVPYTILDRKMFTFNPPVKPETDEQNRADVLHASALAMAKKMYNQQQKMIDSSTKAHARSSSFPGFGDQRCAEEPSLMVHNNLQEAAYRLAQERLTKLQEEHDEQRNLQEYYGSGTPQRTRFGTIKGKLTRRRSSSDGDLLDDKRRSEQIRKQMSLLNNKLTEVDEEKRTRDREALLAAAQRNVKAQMQQMDKKVQSDTGRVPQVATEDWGRKAEVAAQARLAAISHDNAGKVDIGAGKLVDRSEVDKVAAQNVQPLLDEINERAEQEIARIEKQKLEEERRKEKIETEKMREKEVQEIHRKLRDQQKADEKARKAEIKREEKVRKDEAKAVKAEQKHAAEGKRKEAAAFSPKRKETDYQTQSPGDIKNKRLSAVGRVRTLSINFGKRHPRRKTSADKPIGPDDDPVSPTRKVRAWLLSRFPKTRTRATSTDAAYDQESNDSKRSFIGGVALARLQRNSFSSTPSIPAGIDKGKGKEIETETLRPNSSMREIAMAGRPTGSASQPQPPVNDELGEGSGTAAATAGPSTFAAAAADSVGGGDTTTLTVPTTRPGHEAQSRQRPISGLSQVSQVSQGSISVSEGDASPQRRSVSSLSSSGGTTAASGGDEGERFVEARSEPETSGGTWASSLTTPPSAARRSLVVGSGVGGRASPFRESRFSEIL
ncbi:hypothetical protein P885DRAFT_69867 [Corynascus similis CBS 632.67]